MLERDAWTDCDDGWEIYYRIWLCDSCVENEHSPKWLYDDE